MELRTKRDRDFTVEDVSDADSVSVDVFLDIPTDSDPEWQPGSTGAKDLFERVVSCDEQTSDSDSEPEPGTPSPARAKIARTLETRRGRGWWRARRGRSRGRGTTTALTPTASSGERWCGVEDPDITPTQPVFCPSRTPGFQLLTTNNYSALDLFQLFFTNNTLLTIVKNTNEHGRATHTTPSNPWTDITLEDMFSFLSIVVYMGFVKCSSLVDYWRTGPLYSLSYPKNVITGKKFLTISQSLHLSRAKDDAENESKRGTAAFDRLGKIKPLYSEIREACRRNYHPRQHISIDERMVASKARVLFKQYTKNKPVRWGFKLFVLADSINGYTWDFFVYEGKSKETISGNGLGYDSVMSLINPTVLGCGYKLYVDSFYTSPTLFCDLLQQKIWACGTMRMTTAGFPKTTNNTLDHGSQRGSIRWLRKDDLLFVQWKDTSDVFLCSTIHTAHGTEQVQRTVKDKEGHWTVKDVSVPPAIKDYNRHKGGVDLSDALIRYYHVLHKTRKWYKTFFYHFIDIAIVNAFLLHKEICQAKGQAPMNQKTFRETLTLELSQVGSKRSSPEKPSGSTHHRPVLVSDQSKDRRLKCRKCHAKTPIKCYTCDTPLCFVAARDCYNEWHTENNM